MTRQALWAVILGVAAAACGDDGGGGADAAPMIDAREARGTLGLSPYCHACEAERSNIRRRAAGVPPRRQEQPA